MLWRIESAGWGIARRGLLGAVQDASRFFHEAGGEYGRYRVVIRAGIVPIASMRYRRLEVLFERITSFSAAVGRLRTVCGQPIGRRVQHAADRSSLPRLRVADWTDNSP